jgi:hypothetical protein
MFSTFWEAMVLLKSKILYYIPIINSCILEYILATLLGISILWGVV